MRRALLFAIVCLLAGCGDPRGDTERFLNEEMPRHAKDLPGKLYPVPALEPRPVRALVIARDPFRP